MSNVLLCIFFVSIDLVYHFLVITYWFSFSLCCSLFLSNRTLVHGFIILWIVASQLCYNVCLLPFCERVYSLQASREATAADSLNNRLFVIAFLLSIDRWRWWWRPSPRCTGHTGLSCQTLRGWLYDNSELSLVEISFPYMHSWRTSEFHFIQFLQFLEYHLYTKLLFISWDMVHWLLSQVLLSLLGHNVYLVQNVSDAPSDHRYSVMFVMAVSHWMHKQASIC